MNQRHNPPFVGAPDPELRNSPVVEDTDEEFEIYALEYPERPKRGSGCARAAATRTIPEPM